MLINHTKDGIYHILDLLDNETILCLVEFNTYHIYSVSSNSYKCGNTSVQPQYIFMADLCYFIHGEKFYKSYLATVHYSCSCKCGSPASGINGSITRTVQCSIQVIHI